MARRGRRYHRRGGFKLPLISLGILGAQLGLAYYTDSRPAAIAKNLAAYYTGIDIWGGDHMFRPDLLLVGYAPWLVKKFISPIVTPGRALSRMHLPISLS